MMLLRCCYDVVTMLLRSCYDVVHTNCFIEERNYPLPSGPFPEPVDFPEQFAM